MAKRKAAGGTRKAARKSSRPDSRAASRKATGKAAKTARRGATRSTSRSSARTKKKTSAKAATKSKAARKATKSAKATKRVATKRVATKRVAAKRPTKRVVAKSTKATRKAARKAAPVATPRSAPPARGRGTVTVPVRKAPGLNRERRTITDEEEDTMVPSPPSTLDLDRTASAARSGRRQVQHRFNEHTETSPALTAGDVDADWESAYSVGDEAPGGDNPTPDQDIVDDIGRAVGVQYEDNEELKGADKVAKRDEHRWELDPASSEDWDDRD